MKRCIATLLILCLLLACPRVLAADEPPAEPETETGETLPKTGEGEEADLPEAGEDEPAREDTGMVRDEAEEPEEAGV